MRRTLDVSTERKLIGVSIFCFALVIMAIIRPEMFPLMSSAERLNSWYKYILIYIFAMLCLLSFFQAVRTARSYRLLTREEKWAGFLPMIFCMVGLIFFYFWYSHQFQYTLQ